MTGREDSVQIPPSTADWYVGTGQHFLDVSGGQDLHIPNLFPHRKRLDWNETRLTTTPTRVSTYWLHFTIVIHIVRGMAGLWENRSVRQECLGGKLSNSLLVLGGGEEEGFLP